MMTEETKDQTLSQLTEIESQLKTAKENMVTKAQFEELKKEFVEATKKLAAQEQDRIGNPYGSQTNGADPLWDEIQKCNFSAVASREAHSANINLDLKAVPPGTMLTATHANGITDPYVNPEIMPGYRRPPVVESAFNHISTESPNFKYIREKSFTNNADYVPEGELSPLSEMDFEPITGNVIKVSHSVVVPIEMLEDKVQVYSYIQTRMLHALQAKVETELLTGTGDPTSSVKLGGILKEGNYVAHGATVQDLPANANLMDLIVFASVKNASDNNTPTKVFLNDLDWFKIFTMKDANLNYINGASANENRIVASGLEIIRTPAMPKGKFVVADPQGMDIYDRKTLSISAFDQDGENARRGLITLMATRRLGNAIRKISCFVGGDLIVPVAG